MASSIDTVDNSSQPLSCILHVDNEEETHIENRIFPFKPSNWEALKEAAARRKVKRNFQSSKYYDIIQTLPDELDDSVHGYHIHCYKNFTAVPTEDLVQTKHDKCRTRHLRSDRPTTLSPSQSVAAIFPKVCIFCNKARLRKKGYAEETLGACQTKQAEDAIKNAAAVRNDDKLLVLIADVDFIAKEIIYHHSCKRLYIVLNVKLECKANKRNSDNKIATLVATRLVILATKNDTSTTFLMLCRWNYGQNSEEYPLCFVRQEGTTIFTKHHRCMYH